MRPRSGGQSTSGSTRARCRSRSTTPRSRTRNVSSRSFPADFICEALDQTRGFLLAARDRRTLLRDEALPQRRLPPALLLDAGAEDVEVARPTSWPRTRSSTLRRRCLALVLPLASKQLGTAQILARGRRRGVAPVPPPALGASTVSSCLTQTQPRAPRRPRRRRSDLDSWLTSRVHATTQAVREGLDRYDGTSAGRAISELVEDLSKLVRSPLPARFWDGRGERARDAAPRSRRDRPAARPIHAVHRDELYENLDGSLPSVHLCDFPVAGRARPRARKRRWRQFRETVRLGLAARAAGKVKLRQPLPRGDRRRQRPRARSDRAPRRAWCATS